MSPSTHWPPSRGRRRRRRCDSGRENPSALAAPARGVIHVRQRGRLGAELLDLTGTRRGSRLLTIAATVATRGRVLRADQDRASQGLATEQQQVRAALDETVSEWVGHDVDDAGIEAIIKADT